MENFFDVNNLERFYSEHPQSLIFAFVAARYLEQGNITRALEIAEAGLQKFPDYAFGHFVLGECQYELKDFPRAKSHLEISVSLDEKNPRAWKLLGEINERLELPIQAEECYQKFFLLDQFNKEAVEKYQKEEVFELEPFQREEEMPPQEASFSEQLSEQSEEELDSFFEEVESESEEAERISQEVDEVFKETLGELPLGEDELPEELPAEGGPQETEASVSSEGFADEFIRVEEQVPESEEPRFEDTETGEEETGKAEEPAPESEEQPPTNEEETEEEFLDFTSVVEDIISDRESEVEEPEEKAEPGGRTTMTIIRDEGEEEQPSPSQEPASRLPGEETEAGEEKSTHFGRPPILSPTLGEIYIAQGRFEEAIDVFQKLLEKDPDNPRFKRKIKDIEAIIAKQKSQGSETNHS